jgi:hypothetical protein
MGAEGTGGTPQTTVSLDTGGRFIEVNTDPPGIKTRGRFESRELSPHR